MSSTLLLPGDELPLTDGREIRNRLEHQVDCVLDGGHCGIEPTTVVDLAVSPPAVDKDWSRSAGNTLGSGNGSRISGSRKRLVEMASGV